MYEVWLDVDSNPRLDSADDIIRNAVGAIDRVGHFEHHHIAGVGKVICIWNLLIVSKSSKPHMTERVYLDSERVSGGARSEGTTSQEDGRLVTVVVDGNLDVVIGVLRDIAKLDGTLKVGVHCQSLVMYDVQLGSSGSKEISLTSPAETVVGESVNPPNWEASGQL